MTYAVERKILHQHCDPAGLVYYPAYFDLVNEVIEAWFGDVARLPFEEIHGPMNRAVPTVALDVAFTAPSRHGDRISIALRPVKIGRASLTLALVASMGDEPRFTMKSTLVFIDKTTGKPTPWPADARARVACEIEGREFGHA